MYAISTANGYLRPSDCANRQGASLLAVHSNGRGKSTAGIFRSRIKHITVLWVAGEEDHVDDAAGQSNLRLYPPGRGRYDLYRFLI